MLCRQLQAKLPEATYVSDSGNGTTYCSESLRVSAPCRYMGPVNYSSMGFSVPAATRVATCPTHAPPHLATAPHDPAIWNLHL